MVEALTGFELTDALDIGIVAALLYAGISWLRRTRAALVGLGIALVGGVYLAARVLGLELTTTIFQGAFATLALVLVVIFQEEVRQALEELAGWAVGARGGHRPRLDANEILVRSLARLAREKVGALVVLAGAQKLDRYLQGGVELGGTLSSPLLESLFDPHSPGHDGAVVLEDRSVSRFGVQLPLSRNLALVRGGGTRHSAALGLAERTDALCLVVSEERGTISAAANGMLHEIGNERELHSVVSGFYRHRRPLNARRPLMHRLLRERALDKGVCVLAAFALWLLLSSVSG
jgi:uncharacterized protein (TIGR00159 family)